MFATEFIGFLPSYMEYCKQCQTQAFNVMNDLGIGLTLDCDIDEIDDDWYEGEPICNG